METEFRKLNAPSATYDLIKASRKPVTVNDILVEGFHVLVKSKSMQGCTKYEVGLSEIEDCFNPEDKRDAFKLLKGKQYKLADVFELHDNVTKLVKQEIEAMNAMCPDHDWHFVLYEDEEENPSISFEPKVLSNDNDNNKKTKKKVKVDETILTNGE